MKLQKKNNSRRQGLVSVELAMVLPIAFILIMGIIEMGNMYYSWLTIQKAAQIGTRFAVTGQGDDEGTRLSQIIEKTESGMVALRNGSKEINVRSWPDLAAAGDGIDGYPGAPCQLAEVSILYKYEPFTPIIGPLLPATIDLHGYDRKVNEPWKPCD
ncbi:MAG: pilus assembly protein [Pseudodesulfovibrio sp.]|nr:pilus assembly protein [Pseudodesulfovibrio sp.]